MFLMLTMLERFAKVFLEVCQLSEVNWQTGRLCTKGEHSTPVLPSLEVINQDHTKKQTCNSLGGHEKPQGNI